eukprot:2371650-Pyramimonas_sp.AAC.1
MRLSNCLKALLAALLRKIKSRAVDETNSWLGGVLGYPKTSEAINYLFRINMEMFVNVEPPGVPAKMSNLELELLTHVLGVKLVGVGFGTSGLLGLIW